VGHFQLALCIVINALAIAEKTLGSTDPRTAQSLDNLFAFAALTDAVRSDQFDLMFDATLGDDDVRAFLVRANPPAAGHMARLFEEAARRGFWRSRRNSSASWSN
jgi:cobalamin biosynthesis Mg chelatase CobN